MAFFRQFPRTAYTIDGTLLNIPDIFRRVGTKDIFDNIFQNSIKLKRHECI